MHGIGYMGRKAKIGRLHKNYERKRQVSQKQQVGRPLKYKAEHLPSNVAKNPVSTGPSKSECIAMPPTSECITIPPTSEFITIPPTSECVTVPLTIGCATIHLPSASEYVTIPSSTECATISSASECVTMPPCLTSLSHDHILPLKEQPYELTSESWITNFTPPQMNLPQKWNCFSNSNNTQLHIYKIEDMNECGNMNSSTQHSLVISHSIAINQNLTWSLKVNGQHVDPALCTSLASVPSVLNPGTLSEMLRIIETLQICTGQPDDDFVNLLQLRNGKIISPKGSTSAYIDNTPFTSNDKFISVTVRMTQCEILTKTGMCKSCKQYRPTLRKLCNCLKHRTPINSSSHMNDRSASLNCEVFACYYSVLNCIQY